MQTIKTIYIKSRSKKSEALEIIKTSIWILFFGGAATFFVWIGLRAKFSPMPVTIAEIAGWL